MNRPMRQTLGALVLVVAMTLVPATAHAATASDILNALAGVLHRPAWVVATYGANCQPQVTGTNAATLITLIQNRLQQTNDAGAVLNQVIAICQGLAETRSAGDREGKER